MNPYHHSLEINVAGVEVGGEVGGVTGLICNQRQYHFFIMVIILFLYIKEKSVPLTHASEVCL